MIRITALLLIVWGLAVGAAAQEAVATAAQEQQQGDDYLIGPQDVLSISVRGNQDLTGKYTVENDGTFSFPLIGRVKAAGRTQREFENDLKRLLTEGFLKNPQITVAVEEYRSQQVFVVGEVKQPGAYPLRAGVSLIEILARAGTEGNTSSGEAIIVRANNAAGPTLPGEDASAEVIKVDLKDLQGGRVSQNITLHAGDTIFIPRADVVFVFGQVRNPGSYPVPKGATVMQALSLAGGVTEDGATGRVRVIRVVNGEKKEIRVKLAEVVQPGDTVVVPEKFF